MKKMTKEILSYPAVFDPITKGNLKGGFNVSFPDFPGCITFGSSFEKAEDMAKDALSLWIEHITENGGKIPRREKVPLIHSITTKVLLPA